MKKSTKSTKKFEPMTLSQFKAWLNGIEAMQGDDWAPDNNQWKLIRKHIDALMSDVNETQVDINSTPVVDGIARFATPVVNMNQPAFNGAQVPEYLREQMSVPVAPPPTEVNPLFNGAAAGTGQSQRSVANTDGKYSTGFE